MLVVAAIWFFMQGAVEFVRLELQPSECESERKAEVVP